MPTPPFDPTSYLRDTYHGEILGEALFARLSQLENDLARVPKWRLLERLERFVGARLRAELASRGLEGAPPPTATAAEAETNTPVTGKIAEGKKLAATLASLPPDQLMSAFAPAVEGFVKSFREAQAAAPANLADVCQLVTGHEEALLAFFQREAAGEPGDPAIHEFLERNGAPEEPPIPEGMALWPVDASFREDPNPAFHLLHQRAPVHRDRGMASRAILSRHDDVMKIVRDLEFWADPRKSLPDDPVRMFLDPDPDVEPSMLLLDDPAHRRLRNMVSRSFTPRAIEKVRPMVRQVAKELLDAVDPAAGEFDLMDVLASPLPAIAIARLLGVDAGDQALFKEWSVASSEAFFNPLAGEEIQRAGMEAAEKLSAYFREEIARRRAEPRDDLIGKMVAAEQAGDRLTEGEVVGQCNLLLIAGNVTTTDLIGNGVRALLEHPDQLAKLQARPELIGNAVEEMLRFDPPVQSTGRIAPRDIEIDGIPIPRGESITLLLAAANRDPAVYPDPDRFDIEREDTHHQSFGGGAHLCLGAHLARVEAQEGIGALVARFPKLRAVGRATWKQVPGFRGMSDFWVRSD